MKLNNTFRSGPRIGLRPVSSAFGQVDCLFFALDIQYLKEEPADTEFPIDLFQFFRDGFPSHYMALIKAVLSFREAGAGPLKIMVFVHAKSRSKAIGEGKAIAKAVQDLFESGLGIDRGDTFRTVTHLFGQADYGALLKELKAQMPRFFYLPGGSDSKSKYTPVNTDSWRLRDNCFDFTPWSQDPFISLRGTHGHITLLEPYGMGRFEDQYLVEQITSATEITSVGLPYDIPGGNLLVGNSYAILGQSYSEKEPSIIGLEDMELKDLSNHLGIPVIQLPTPANTTTPYYPPLPHLDLYLTIGGLIQVGPLTKHLVLVAELTPESVFGTGIPSRDELMRKRDDLNRIAGFLGQVGFEVRRIPLVWDDQSEIYLSYNNALVEADPMGEWKRIYLPSYYKTDHVFAAHFMRVETCLRRQLESLGFDVTFIEGPFSALGAIAGGLRCLIKVLKRRELPMTQRLDFQHTV